MKVAQASDMRSCKNRSLAKGAQAFAVLFLATILTGCSSASDLDVFGIFDESAPATTTAGQAKLRASADAQSEAARDQPTPKLSSVPERPVAPTQADVRQNIVEGLVADRENARYNDQSIRLQGGSRKTFSTTPPPPPAPKPEVATPPPATPTPTPPAAAPAVEREVASPTPTAAPPPPTAPAVERAVVSPPPAAPSPPPQTASVPPPPVPVPAPTAPRSSVQVDLAALESGPSPTTSGSAVTPDEQVATIHFLDSSSKLDDLDRRIIAQVASAQRETNAQIVVIGHASGRTQKSDKVEHELANFRMSLARANRVASQLIAMGVDPDKVQVEAVADANPLYSENEPTGEAGNRRADIYFRQ